MEENKRNTDGMHTLDYNTCNQLRFNFRDNIHKYALVFIVFMSAYLAYAKYTLDQLSKNTQIMTNSSVAKNSSSGTQKVTHQPSEVRYTRFFAFVGIGFGVTLSLSYYVGIRMYCRSRSLSVCAIRSQQIIRDQIEGESVLLSGLKVLNHRRYHAVIPHGVSRGEYQTVFLHCILALIPIFLSYPFFDIFLLPFKGAYYGLVEICWFMTLAVFLFFFANTAENTFGHLSEANAITDSTKVPILEKKWGHEGRDPGSRIYRKEGQRVFTRGYLLLLTLALFIYFNGPLVVVFNLIMSCMLSCLDHFPNNPFTNFGLSCLLTVFLYKIGKKVRNEIKFRARIFYFSYIVGFYIILLFACKLAKLLWPYLSVSSPKKMLPVFFTSLQLSSLKILLLALCIALSVKIFLLISYKFERFKRLSILLQSKAIYSSAKKYGMHNGETWSRPEIQNFTLDVLAYKIFKKSCFTYKDCFDYEDCRKSGVFFRRLKEHDKPVEGKKAKKLKKWNKIVPLLYPKIGRMLYDCWNVEKIEEEFYMSINGTNNNRDRIGVFFPTWLGDCIMARGAIEIVNGLFDESVEFVPVLNQKRNSILGYDNYHALIVPEAPYTSFKHAKLKLPVNWFKKRFWKHNFIYRLDGESFRAAFFFNRDYYLSDAIKVKTFEYKEKTIREESELFRNSHRVDLMVQFVTQNLKKMGYSVNSKTKEGVKNYSLSTSLVTRDTKRIGVFPFSSNHNRYKGLGSSKVAQLINLLKGKYEDEIEIVMLESGKHQKQFDQIKGNVRQRAVEFCPENCDEFKRLSYVITIDTGSLHLAQFYSIPSTGIYGPTHPHETGPYLSEYKHCVVKAGKRSNDNVRVDKKVVLDNVLAVDDAFRKICKHIESIGIL